MTRWVLRAFEKTGDELISEHTLEGVHIDEIRSLTGQPDSNPMYDVYPVSKAQASWVEAKTGQTLDFSQFDYFVEGLFD